MEHASYGWAKRVLDMGDKPTLHVLTNLPEPHRRLSRKGLLRDDNFCVRRCLRFPPRPVEFPGSRDATDQYNCGESRRACGPGHPFYVPQMPASS